MQIIQQEVTDVEVKFDFPLTTIESMFQTKAYTNCLLDSWFISSSVPNNFLGLRTEAF